MPRLSERDLQAIKRRIRMAEQHYERELKENFKRSLDLYTGQHYDNPHQLSDRARVVVNYVLHVEETKVHSVAFKYPDFVLKARTPDAEGRESIGRAALSYTWRESCVQREMKRAWKDKEIYGVGVVYTGWLFETEDGMRMENGRHPTFPEPQLDATPNPTDAFEPVMVQNVRTDRFLARRINPNCFFVSPECDRVLENADYCGFFEVRPLEEVKANPHFKNTRQLKGTCDNLRKYFDRGMQEEYLGAEEEDKAPADVKRVKLYHYFEKKRRLHIVMTDEHDKPLLIEYWTWEHDRYPFRVRQNPGDEDQFWALPGPLLIEHQQRELNEARSQLSNHRRRFVPKFQAPQGILSAKAKEALRSDVAGEVVEHGSSEPAPVVPIQVPNVQAEVYTTEDRVVSDIQTIAGVNQYQLGRAPTKRTPTAEVEAIQQAGGARAQNDQQEFEQWCAEVAEDCLSWLKMYSVKTRTLPIYDADGNIQDWRDFTGEEIRGQFDVEVYVGSTTPPNNAEKIQSIAYFLQALNPLLQQIPVASQFGINLIPLIRQLLKGLPDIRNVNEILPNQQVNPMLGLAAGAVPQDPLAMGMQSGVDPAGAVDPSAGGGALPFAPVDDRKIPQFDLVSLLQQAGAY